MRAYSAPEILAVLCVCVFSPPFCVAAQVASPANTVATPADANRPEGFSEGGTNENAEKSKVVLSASDVTDLMRDQPLSDETWPAWRSFYMRLYFTNEVDEPSEFYERLRLFIAAKAAQGDGGLSDQWAEDPIVWVVLSSHFSHATPPFAKATVAAARQAIALGDPAGISSHTLSGSIIRLISQQGTAGQLTQEQLGQLDEAEELLLVVEQRSPQARLSHWRGLIAWLRGDQAEALRLLRAGVDEHPHQPSAAGTYLTLWMSSTEAVKPFRKTSLPLVEQHPEDAQIRALHILALYRDELYSEAWESLEQARQEKMRVEQFLGQEGIERIEEGRWLTPLVMGGITLLNDKAYKEAAHNFRKAVAREPKNVLAAQFLARSLVEDLGTNTGLDSKDVLEGIIGECADLCEQHPDDPELHVAHAAALFRAGRAIEADSELRQAKELGGDLSELIDPSAESMIHKSALSDRISRNVVSGLLALAAASATWLCVMFLLGAILAACTSRSPRECDGTDLVRTTADGRLERFYLFVLGLSLFFFYLSVPFVALGMFAITLVLFGLMLAMRIIHFGILSRGFFATWGVMRSAFIGPSHECFGILAKPEEQPHLFGALREVADRLDTYPVEEVYLTPSSAIGVREGGKGPFGLLKRKRVMEIGIPTMSQLTCSEFKSILAHEYGHFTHQDHFFTRVITQVTMSLANSLAVMNAAGGELNYLNPFYWFYWLYLRAYALLAAGFSRSREFLADRRAVLAYGKNAFIAGLTKAVVDGTVFDGTAVRNIKAAMDSGDRFVNVFEAFRSFKDQPEVAEKQKQTLESIRAAKPRWFDSHPTYSERIAAVEKFPDATEKLDASPAVELFSDYSRVEEQLTELLTQAVYSNFGPVETPANSTS